jgi:hypothetical protein
MKQSVIIFSRIIYVIIFADNKQLQYWFFLFNRQNLPKRMKLKLLIDEVNDTEQNLAIWHEIFHLLSLNAYKVLLTTLDYNLNLKIFI